MSDEELLKKEEEFKKKYPDIYSPYQWADPLVAKYPNLFRRTKVIPVGIGWAHIIESLLEIIDHHVSTLPLEQREKIHVAQIKEKFGGLRFYLTDDTPYIQGAISFASLMSEATCEDCGAPGIKKSVSSWIKCRCNVCYLKAVERQKEEALKYATHPKKAKK